MNAHRAAQLLAANEQLVLAIIRAQDEALAAAQALRDAPIGRTLEIASRGDAAQLFNHLVHAMALARRGGSRLGLLIVCIGNLGQLTDELGRAVGQRALEIAKQRLVAMVRQSDSVSALGTDEFLVLLPSVKSANDALMLADSLIASIAMPVQLTGRTIHMRATIGLSVFPDDGDDGDALLDRATAAMYSARRRGLGSYFFRDETGSNARSTELRSIESRSPAEVHHRDADISELQREANEQLLLASLRTQELLAAAELAHRHQTEFIGVVAHELRGPLGPISNAATLLGYVKSPEPAVAAAQKAIEGQVRQMSRLVSDLLDVTRINTGKLRLDIQRLDLSELVSEAIDSVRPTFDARAQVLRLDVAPPPMPINGDHVRLVQVVTNILSNASKYTPRDGEISISLAISGDTACIAIEDNGIGITPDALSHVFEPFVQESHATSFDSSGLGIGLSLVRELVHGHGGEVFASSSGPGTGSRFVVTLPLRQSQTSR
ncbi:MAG TPA: ATP-binding protein [Ramlibacter sp.]|nr:ATP-binding protein [Ramlibacter sp.]